MSYQQANLTNASPASFHSTVTARLNATRNCLLNALTTADRAPNAAMLLAVSKTRPAKDIREAYGAGQRAFGENYMQDALSKQPALSDLAIEWHFIGALQSNKTREAATHFDWVHTVDRAKIARRLNDQRPKHLPPLQICLQVNISRDSNKSGVLVEEVDNIVHEILEMPRLVLRGLMTIPAQANNAADQRAPFKALRQLMDALRERFPQAPWDTLSMGMSADMDDAVREGATIVRVGTAIFGERVNSTHEVDPT